MPDTQRPFTTFNFELRISLPGSSSGAGNQRSSVVAEASFSECDGIEMSIEPKTIREGGNNTRQIHLMGPVSYGSLTLKRGVTDNMDLWSWFERVQTERSLRADAELEVRSSDGEEVDAKYKMTGCLPLKVRAPALNAKEGGVAIEEIQIAYETLSRHQPG